MPNFDIEIFVAHRRLPDLYDRLHDEEKLNFVAIKWRHTANKGDFENIFAVGR